MAGVLGFGGFGVSIFALISVIVSVALDYWVYLSKDGLEVYSGLWKGCVTQTFFGQSVKSCASISDASTELNAVRAMLILALLLDVGAIVCGALKLFMMKENKMLGYVAAGLLLVAGLFLIVGFGVYVSKLFDAYKILYDGISLHAGFAFCIIGWLASWAGAALFGVATMQADE